jgi:mono/diheme cytochrome c family protein
MARAGKVLRIGLFVFLIALVAGISFAIGWRPFIGPKRRALTNRQFERTPERLARGRYLTQGLLGCVMCHSQKNFAIHGAPTVAGMDLAGQVLPLPGFPGSLTAPNITPDRESGGGNWTDDQYARAIREGIGHDERTIFPIMPYQHYKELSDEDLAAVVVYLRSLPPVRNPLPPSQIKFPVNYLVQGAPEPVTEVVRGPDPADRLATGKYLAGLGCGCHSAVKSLDFGGGEVLKGPWGETTSSNITPDPSGISYYDEATFIKVLRTGYVGARKLNSIMPFGDFQNLTEDDLKAIFAYLRTVPPVHHRVDNSLPPTYCKVCKAKHGAGDQN